MKSSFKTRPLLAPTHLRQTAYRLSPPWSGSSRKAGPLSVLLMVVICASRTIDGTLQVLKK